MNIKKKTNSINFKTLSYFIIFATAILFALWIFQIVFLKVFYEKYQIQDINKISRKIAKLDIISEEELEDIAFKNNVCIEYVKDGSITYFNEKMPACEFNKPRSNINMYKKDLSLNTDTISTIKLVNNEFDVRGILSSIKLDNAEVFVYSTLEDVNSTTVVLQNQLIYIILLAIVLSCVLAWYISRRLTKPIVDITKSAKKMGEGNYDVVFKQSGIEEIDELADTLNYAKKEISKIDELRRDLMANVSHDLKTPLTMIKAYAEMIKDFSYKDEEKRNQHLDIIIDETNRLNTLVNDILLLSKSQADVDNLNIEEYDLVMEVKSILKKYEIIKETEDYKILLNAPKKAMIKADKNKLNQVIYNLINNAINYTGKDKKVTVKIIEENKKYIIQIIDTGKGIKEEDLKHIWDKYYKNDKNHQRNVVGTGLGLSIVKSILTQHNFKFGVESKINKGTTFYFEIKK